METQEINIEGLEKVKGRIKRLKHPEHLDMDTYGRKGPCGTVCCIAGYTLLVNKVKTPRELVAAVNDPSVFSEIGIFNTAKDILRLSEDQAMSLFLLSHWPYKFKEAYWRSRSGKNRRDIAVARIQRFIDTKGAE